MGYLKSSIVDDQHQANPLAFEWVWLVLFGEIWSRASRLTACASWPRSLRFNAG